MILSPREPLGDGLLAAALGGLLAGCGLTTRNESPEPAPDAGPDAAIDPGDPCVARPAIAEPADNCAYPVAPVADPPRLDSVESLKQPDCQYRLGEPIALPFSEGRYAFSFDVNGDRVGDVFFWNTEHDALELAVSRVEDGRLSYEPVTCAALEALGERVDRSTNVFVRDLNGDAVPDLVLGYGSLAPADANIGVELGAWVNLPSGFVEVLRYDWPDPVSKTSLLDVAVADFDRDGGCVKDIAFGYDRVYGSLSGPQDGADDVEWGGLVTLIDWPSWQYDYRNWAYDSGAPNGDQYPEIDGEQVFPIGELTAAVGTRTPLWIGLEDDAETSVSGLFVEWDDNGPVEQVVHLPTPENVARAGGLGPYDMWLTPLWDMKMALVLVYGLLEHLVVYDFDDETHRIVLSHPLLGDWGYGREFGGVTADFRHALLDVDGDGDADFVEVVNNGFFGPASLAIHRNENNTFAEGIEFEVSHYGGNGEHPFVAVGDAQAALIVDTASGEDGSGPPTVQPLECAP